MSDPNLFPRSTDSYLEILGVPAAVDDAALTSAWRSCSRRWHPDRFATSDAQTQETAEWAAAIANDAYRALANPVDRAAYLLLRHRGVRPDNLKGSAPAGLFVEMLEIQESVEEALESSDRETAAIELGRSADALAERLQGLRESLQSAFLTYDSGGRDAALDAMQEAVAVHGYLRRASETVAGALKTLSVA